MSKLHSLRKTQTNKLNLHLHLHLPAIISPNASSEEPPFFKFSMVTSVLPLPWTLFSARFIFLLWLFQHIHFFQPNEFLSLLLQETSIELLVIHDDGHLQSVCDQPVFGIIKDLAVLSCNQNSCPNDPQVCHSPCLV